MNDWFAIIRNSLIKTFILKLTSNDKIYLEITKGWTPEFKPLSILR